MEAYILGKLTNGVEDILPSETKKISNSNIHIITANIPEGIEKIYLYIENDTFTLSKIANSIDQDCNPLLLRPLGGRKIEDWDIFAASEARYEIGISTTKTKVITVLFWCFKFQKEEEKVLARILNTASYQENQKAYATICYSKSEKEKFKDLIVEGVCEHFDNGLLGGGTTPETSSVINQQKEYIEELERLCQQQKHDYEALKSSTFWKITSPARKMVDLLKGTKKNDLSLIKKPAIAVHLHLYYEELLEEFCDYLDKISEPFDLFVSCREGVNQKKLRTRLLKIFCVNNVIVKNTFNRGRDIAPFYVLFGDELKNYSYLLHIHSKKSLYTGNEKTLWRQWNLNGVLKNEKMFREVLRIFHNEPDVGLIFGEMEEHVPLFALGWLKNAEKGARILSQLGISFENGMQFYPVGSFFWARTEAIKPLFDLKLKYDDFDEEKGQIDGTLAHALERVITQVARSRNYHSYIYNPKLDFFVKDRSYYCFRNYFNYTVDDVADYLQKYDIITFDIFDTLITRIIYKPDDLFKLMQRIIKNRYGTEVDYLKVRKEAERKAVEEYAAFCNIDNIYQYLPEVSDFTVEQAEELKQLEIDLEFKVCIPRKDVLKIFNQLVAADKKIILISDMYLPSQIVEEILKKCGYTGYSDLWISCEKGVRKDTDTIWDVFFKQYEARETIHVGDNCQSDCQNVSDRKRDYMLLMSPIEQFRLSQAYDKFASYTDSSIEDSLVLGYFVNKIMYNSPFALRWEGTSILNKIEDVSQAIFAPVFLQFVSYIHKVSEKDTKLLFLAREGFFLRQLYRKYCKVFGYKEKSNYYFLTSRRAASIPSICNFEDINQLLGDSYEGGLNNLLINRFGFDNNLLDKQNNRSIVLPRDKGIVLNEIINLSDEFYKNIQNEKENYLIYINQLLGKNFNWDHALLIDVGYAGSIQLYLMKLLKRKLHGCYLALGYTVKPPKEGGICTSVYRFQTSKTLWKTQLFLEAVTAAPHGQLIKFEDRNGKVWPILKERRETQYDIARLLQKGIYTYIEEVGSLTKDINPSFNRKLSELILEECLRPGIFERDMKKIFQVNDVYCNNGTWVFNESSGQWEIVPAN